MAASRTGADITPSARWVPMRGCRVVSGSEREHNWPVGRQTPTAKVPIGNPGRPAWQAIRWRQRCAAGGRISRLLRPDTGVADQVAPLGDLGLHAGGELLRRAPDRIGALLGDALADVG